jgi:hypothetical protein
MASNGMQCRQRRTGLLLKHQPLPLYAVVIRQPTIQNNKMTAGNETSFSPYVRTKTKVSPTQPASQHVVTFILA